MTQVEMISYNLNALDQYANKIENYLDGQYNKGRIKGTDYAATYAQLLSTAIQVTASMATQAVQADSQQKQTNAQVELTNQQTEVAKKQARSFDLQTKLSLFKNQMDTFAMIYSSNPDAEEIPDVLKKSNVNSLYNEINNSVRI
jgi:hypothetical protein